jgi:hypothetical protein
VVFWFRTNCCHCDVRIRDSGRIVMMIWTRSGSSSLMTRAAGSGLASAKYSLERTTRFAFDDRMSLSRRVHSHLGGGRLFAVHGELCSIPARTADSAWRPLLA